MQKKERNTVYPDLDGKTVVITGSNRGIGKNLAETFIRNNCQLVCMYRRTAPVFGENIGGNFDPIMLKADVNDIETIAAWVNKFTNDGNELDVLINNAGLYIKKALIDIGVNDWHETMDTNLKSTFFISQMFSKHMKKKGRGGVIINASSFTATIPSANYGLYSISKAAIAHLTRCMAAEWAPYNIRVNAFSPGIVKTRMTSPALNQNECEVLKAISMRRTGTLQEISNVVLFLASEASSYITGQNINVNGGKFAVQNPHSAWE